jgi:hypothetical protein
MISMQMGTSFVVSNGRDSGGHRHLNFSTGTSGYFSSSPIFYASSRSWIENSLSDSRNFNEDYQKFRGWSNGKIEVRERESEASSGKRSGAGAPLLKGPIRDRPLQVNSEKSKKREK